MNTPKDDFYRQHLDLTEPEFRQLLDEGETELRRIITPQPGRVDPTGMIYEWLDSGPWGALCPWRGGYSVAGLAVKVGSVKVEKHPSAWVFVWVVSLKIA